MNKVNLSFCITNYNRANTLLKIVDDCLHQTIPPFEIIVQDNASDKKELEIIKKNLPKQVKLFINKKNVGIIDNINKTIQRARGNYLAILHNDDRISKYYVEEIINNIQKNSSYNIYTTNCIGINHNNLLIGEFRIFDKNIVMKKGQGISRLWDKDYFIFLCELGATVYKSSFIQKYYLDPKYGNESDLFMALTFLRDTNIYYIDKPLYCITIHEDQVSNKNKSTEKLLHDYISNSLNIYKSFEKDYKHIPFYLTKLKTLYTIQLLFKYRYSIFKIKKVLLIDNSYEIFLYFLLLPSFIKNIIEKKVRFILHKAEIKQYFPNIIA